MNKSRVPFKDAGRINQTDFELKKLEISEQKNAQEVRKLTAELHESSIRADIAETKVDITSNEFYQIETERDISLIKLDEMLIKRDISEVQLEQTEGELRYVEARLQLQLEKWTQELRGLSLEIDFKEFQNDSKESITAAQGAKLTSFDGILSRLLGGK